MIKKWLAAAALAGAFASAWAAVDVNTATESALIGIKGIGPARAKAIVDERDARGPFKSAEDLASRVKGLGGQTVGRLQGEGLTIGTAGAAPVLAPAAKAAATKPAAPAAAPAAPAAAARQAAARSTQK